MDKSVDFKDSYFGTQDSNCRTVVGAKSTFSQKRNSEEEHVSLCLIKQKIGEGNGTPLQCSCLENPTDGGAS